MLKADSLTRPIAASRPRVPGRPLRLLVVEDEALSAEILDAVKAQLLPD